MKEENFENNMKKLEQIAEELETGKLDLDTSMKKFEEGMKLSKKCSDELEKAEKKIKVLLEKDGKLVEEDYDE